MNSKNGKLKYSNLDKFDNQSPNIRYDTEKTQRTNI